MVVGEGWSGRSPSWEGGAGEFTELTWSKFWTATFTFDSLHSNSDYLGHDIKNIASEYIIPSAWLPIMTTIQSKLGYSSKKALLLGAGFVTKPTVQILADAGVEVTVGKSGPSQ